MSESNMKVGASFPQGLPDLATLLSDAARSWEAEDSLEDTLNAIAQSAVDVVPGADYAGVSLIRPPHSITTPAATDDLVRAADAVQELLAEGPCVEAMWEKRTVRVDDLATDRRWPAFGPRAVSLGVASMLAFRLFTGGDTWGALNLYSRRSNAFAESSEFIGALLASHASIALAGSREISLLTKEINARDLVSRATGVMMERHRIGPGAAYDMLLAMAKASGWTISDVSAWTAGVEPTPAKPTPAKPTPAEATPAAALPSADSG